MELKNYRYVAYDVNKKIVRGTMEALNRSICIKFLRAKNYEIIRLSEYKNILTKLNSISVGSILKPKQLVFFLKQLGSLLKSGVNLLAAIELLSIQQENQLSRRLFFEIYQHIYNGQSFSWALSQKPKEFPILLCQMIEIGEITGDLPDTIVRLSLYYENQIKIINNIKSAVRMPMIYLVIVFLIATGMLLFVFPNITDLYSSFEGAELPGITAFFLKAGEFLENYALIIFGSLFVGISTLLLLNKYVAKFHYWLTSVILKMPIFGTLIRMNNQILISNSLAQMMSRGINAVEALTIAPKLMTNVIYKELMHKTLAYIEEGQTFSRAFEESPYIDVVMARMISTGEKSGDIPRLLENLSTYYNGVADLRVEQIRASIQPILLLVVYAIVGVMLLALMMPMLSLGGQI